LPSGFFFVTFGNKLLFAAAVEDHLEKTISGFALVKGRDSHRFLDVEKLDRRRIADAPRLFKRQDDVTPNRRMLLHSPMFLKQLFPREQTAGDIGPGIVTRNFGMSGPFCFSARRFGGELKCATHTSII
jgi:hypothetical protein